MLHTLAVENYRSLRDVVIPLDRLTLVTGPNGSGKSNLYRALRLLHEVANGRATAALAHEGGLQSVLWAGPERISRRMKGGEVAVQGGPRREPVALRVGFGSTELGYAIDFGLPIPSNSEFSLDPEIKRESIWHGENWQPRTAMFEREGPAIRARDAEGHWQLVTTEIHADESALAFVADPRQTPEAFALRETVRAWRFYDHFRTDRDAPVRMLQIGTRTPALHHDGRDLAAALQTILEVGDAAALRAAVDDAFPRAHLSISSVAARMGLEFQQHGLLRALDQSELSDGTLRYFLWLAALLTPPPWTWPRR